MLEKLISAWPAAADARERRMLNETLKCCDRLLSERGEANGRAIATEALKRYDDLQPATRNLFFEALANRYSPDPDAVLMAAQTYAQEPTARALVALQKAIEPPRQELFRRLNRAPGGTSTLVQMRAQWLGLMGSQPQWQALDADLHHLFSSWFSPGFLELRRIDWHSPAYLLEQLIEHEAVHAIDGWSDLRRRLEPDRRCFGFFHPSLPEQLLIFVEVALVSEMPAAVQPLLAPSGKPSSQTLPDPKTARVAVFYSISNCQPGLKGVSLGNFLIKQVVEALRAELPALKTFCTLSPIPNFARWLGHSGLHDQEAPALAERREALRVKLKTQSEPSSDIDDELTALASMFLSSTRESNPASDPVAKFHLNNGARLERVNVGADSSKKGIKQSHGLMVNYLYALDDIEANHQAYQSGEVVRSRKVAALATR